MRNLFLHQILISKSLSNCKGIDKNSKNISFERIELKIIIWWQLDDIKEDSLVEFNKVLEQWLSWYYWWKRFGIKNYSIEWTIYSHITVVMGSVCSLWLMVWPLFMDVLLWIGKTHWTDVRPSQHQRSALFYTSHTIQALNSFIRYGMAMALVWLLQTFFEK